MSNYEVEKFIRTVQEQRFKEEYEPYWIASKRDSRYSEYNKRNQLDFIKYRLGK